LWLFGVVWEFAPFPFSAFIVTEEAIIAVMASLIEFLSWDIVLNIPLARACSVGRKFAVITRFDTLNNKSDITGDRHIAGKAATQYDDFGERAAYTAGDTALRRDAARTRILAGSLSTRKSVSMLVAKPIDTIGKNRKDSCVAEMCWTSWKWSVVK
jgi:hypothetical protein